MRCCFAAAIVRTRAARAAGLIRDIAGVLAAIALIAVSNETASAAIPTTGPAPRATSRPASVADCTTAPIGHVVAGVLGYLPALAPVSDYALLESALQIAFDPETGSWGLASLARTGTPLLAEADAVSRTSDDLVETLLPAGGVMLHLRGRFQTLSVASRTARGGVQLGCAESPLGLYEWLRQDAPVLDTTGWPEQ